MVRLFASVLRREPDGSHVLVTPVEKLDYRRRSHRLPRHRDDHEGEGASSAGSRWRSTVATR